MRTISTSCAPAARAAKTALVILVLAAPSALAQLVFADGFESGTAALWSSATGVTSSCATGGALGGMLEGDLAAAPTTGFVELACLEVHNDQNFERFEVAFSGVPLPAAFGFTTTDDLVVVGAGNRVLAAQFHVLSRWGAPLVEATAPIRWLEVSLPARVAASSVARYSLRRYAGWTPPTDPFAVEVSSSAGTVTIDTGLATFVLDPDDPRFFTSIAVDLDDDGIGRFAVANGTAGTGPRLSFDPGGGPVVLDTTVAGRVVVDPGGFDLVRLGPTRAVARMNGHFVAPAGASRCTRNGLDYERFGFTVVAAFTRGSRDVDLEYHLRNECSDGAVSGDGNALTDDAIAILGSSFELPLALGSSTHFHGSAGALGSSTAGFSGTTRVEQARGGGTPWAQIARVRRNGTPIETTTALDDPLIAIADTNVVVGATMPWMRWREPQALGLANTTLSLAVVGENLVVGEGKGIWGTATLHLRPRAQVATPTTYLQALRAPLRARVERGLLVRAPRGVVDAARMFAPLGTDTPSTFKADYLLALETIHQQTVTAGGQWDRAKTYGSQLWPETQYDEFAIDNPDPFSNFVPPNYWMPVATEAMEYLRSGDPKWLWEFSLPQTWLQLSSAYLNLGDQTHSNRNGLAVNSGGGGEGHWHRSNFGSDEYTYNLGFDVVYATRPNQPQLDRINRTGQTVVDRYSIPWANQALREQWVNQVDVNRGAIQHFVMLANCAEFSPGARGQACHARLQELLTELSADNLQAGLFCVGDIPSATTCTLPQQFMSNALFYHFFHRMYLAYGNVGGPGLRRALVDGPRHYATYGIDRLPDGISLDPNGVFAASMSCDLSAGGTEVVSCTRTTDADGNVSVFDPVRPHTLTLLLLAHDLDPTVDLCGLTRTALDALDPETRWQQWYNVGSGWWKGSAQMLVGATVGVGVYETCTP